MPSAAALPQGRQEVEQLIRDVVESGAEVRAPRTFLHFWTRYRSLSPDQAAEELLQGQTGLLIQAGALEALPLKSLQDLEEAAIFQKVMPAPAGSTHERLLALAEQGIRFHDDQGRELGPYGAYNALTDPDHNLGPLGARNHNGTVPLPDEQRLSDLHQFAIQSPLAAIERQGFQFFDREGNVQPAFMAQNGRVGTDGDVWLEVGNPATLEQRLQTFSDRRERVDGDLEVARRLESVTAENLAASLEGLKTDRRQRLARAALQEMGPDSLLLAGPSTPADLQELWLEAAAPTHEAAAVALEVHRRAPFARQIAWEETLRQADDGLALARKLLTDNDRLDWDRRQELSGALLAGLTRCPATRAGAEALQGWQAQDKAQGVQSLLASPGMSLRELALQGLASWDGQAQQRAMAGLGGPLAAPLGALHAGLQNDGLRHEIFKLASQQPADDRKTQEDLLRVLQGQSLSWEDRMLAGNFMLERLSGLPETARAAIAARSWQAQDPLQAAQLVLEDPSRPDDEIARRAITAWDTEGQQRFLQGLKGPVAESLRGLHASLSNSNAQHIVFQIACQNPADNPKTQRELLDSLQGQSMSWEDRSQVGTYVLENLSRLPETARAAAAASSWQPQDPFQAARIVLEDPTRSDDEIALRAITAWDTEGQQRYLQGLQGPLAASLRTLHESLASPNAQHPIFQLACQSPPDNPETVQKLLAAVEGQSMQWDDRQKVGAFALQRLSQLPQTSRAAGAASSWQPQDPFQAAKIVLEDPTRSEDEIARRAITAWDSEGQQRYMQGLQGPLAASLYGLHQSLSHDNSRHEVFQLACKKPQGTTGKELAPAFLSLFQALDGKPANWEDRPRLGNFVLDELAARPDTAAAARTVRQWKLNDPYEAARALSEHPELSTPQQLDALALAAISSWDTEAQKNHLEALVARPGAPGWLSRLLEVHNRFESDEARTAVWRLAAQGSLGDLSDLSSKLQSLSMSWEDRQILDGMVRDIQAEIEARKLVEGFQEKNQAVAVEEERVVVGGVVLRRKYEKPPQA